MGDFMFNIYEFINWTVEGKRKVVVIPKIGEVIRGTALTFQDNILQIKTGADTQQIKVEDISDIFSVGQKPQVPRKPVM